MQDDCKNRWMPPLGVCCSIAGDWAGDQNREPERWSEQAGPTGSVATATRAEETSVGIKVGTGMAVRGEWIGRRPWAQKASGAGGCSGHGPETGGWADFHNGERHRRTGGHEAGLLHQRSVDQGLCNCQLKQLPIADRPGRPAMALPCSRQSKSRPAQLMGGAGDGGIGAAGSAKEQPLDRPDGAAGEELSRHPLVGPGQITAAAGCDQKRAGRA